MPRHNTHTVTLPAAAAQAAHQADDHFDFWTLNANGPPTSVPAADNLPPQAKADPPVSGNIGPPQALLDQAADMAETQFAANVPRRMDDDDDFNFSNMSANRSPADVPPEPLQNLLTQAAPQAAEHVPDDAGPPNLPSEASSTEAATQIASHVPWLIDIQ